MKENVNKVTETVGTIQSRSVMIDGPTPNGTNTFNQDEIPSVQSGLKFMEGRSWATIPRGANSSNGKSTNRTTTRTTRPRRSRGPSLRKE